MNNCSCYENEYELVIMDDNIKCINPYMRCKEFIKEKHFKIPPGKPDIEQITKIIIKPKIISCKEICTPEGPKVVLRGLILQKLFYIADTPDQCIHCATFKFPFYTFIKIDHCVKITDIQIMIEDFYIQVLNKKRLEESILILICISSKKDCCKPSYDCNYKYKCNPNKNCKNKCKPKPNHGCNYKNNHKHHKDYKCDCYDKCNSNYDCDYDCDCNSYPDDYWSCNDFC